MGKLEIGVTVEATVGDAPPKPAPKRASVEVLGGYRSKLERDYALKLAQMKANGDIRDWRYEPLRLRIGRGAYYKPDFLVVRNDGVFQFEEVKGHWREAARVRIKVACDLFPWWGFLAITRVKGQWRIEAF